MRGAKLTCQAVSDGRRGIENQALGLAEAVARLTPMDIKTRHVEAAGLLGVPLSRLGFRDPPAGPPPDLWIGCGRAALAEAFAARQAWPETRFIYVQDPKTGHDLFDLIAAPDHDGLNRTNAIALTGSPNRITVDRLKSEARRFAATLDALPSPRAAVLIGGPSKRHRFDAQTIERLTESLATLISADWGVMITASRRTPEPVNALIADLAGLRSVEIYDGAGDNPYFAYLHAADAVLVTADSTNMLTEAASAGKPVWMLPTGGKPGKFGALYDSLIEDGHARWWTSDLSLWTPPGLDETARLAKKALSLLDTESRHG